MDFKDQPFIPMLFGGDINTYSVARAFYEEYQVKTYVFGKFPSGPSYNSNIIEYHADLKIDTDDVFMKTVRDFAARRLVNTAVSNTIPSTRCSFNAWEDTSITTYLQPASAIFRKISYSS